MHADVRASCVRLVLTVRHAAGPGECARGRALLARRGARAAGPARRRARNAAARRQGTLDQDGRAGVRDRARAPLPPVRRQRRSAGVLARASGRAAGWIARASVDAAAAGNATGCSPISCRSAARRRWSGRPSSSARRAAVNRACRARLVPDLSATKRMRDCASGCSSKPASWSRAYQAISRSRSRMRATGLPVTDLQPYLGAWGHAFIVSADLADAVHSHPDDTAHESGRRQRSSSISDSRARACTASGRSSCGTDTSRPCRSPSNVGFNPQSTLMTSPNH